MPAKKPTTAAHLQWVNSLKLPDSTMLLALTGWMDGGSVSTGTVRQLMADRDLVEVAHIDPDPFYIYNFPGSMEVAALFRPNVTYAGGMVDELSMPENAFFAAPDAKLLFFLGQEPNLKWQAFADGIFGVCKEVGIKRIIFIGSFGGSVPHTREPRLFGSVSHESLKPILNEYAVKASDYEGPSSFATLLMAEAPERGLEMLSFSAEIPGYLEGENPVSIEAVTRRMSRILNTPVDLTKLRRTSDEWEAKVTRAVEKDKKLAATIRDLEEQYDNQLIAKAEEQ